MEKETEVQFDFCTNVRAKKMKFFYKAKRRKLKTYAIFPLLYQRKKFTSPPQFSKFNFKIKLWAIVSARIWRRCCQFFLSQKLLNNIFLKHRNAQNINSLAIKVYPWCSFVGKFNWSKYLRRKFFNLCSKMRKGWFVIQ